MHGRRAAAGPRRSATRRGWRAGPAPAPSGSAASTPGTAGVGRRVDRQARAAQLRRARQHERREHGARAAAARWSAFAPGHRERRLHRPEPAHRVLPATRRAGRPRSRRVADHPRGRRAGSRRRAPGSTVALLEVVHAAGAARPAAARYPSRAFVAHDRVVDRDARARVGLRGSRASSRARVGEANGRQEQRRGPRRRRRRASFARSAHAATNSAQRRRLAVAAARAGERSGS